MHASEERKADREVQTTFFTLFMWIEDFRATRGNNTVPRDSSPARQCASALAFDIRMGFDADQSYDLTTHTCWNRWSQTARAQGWPWLGVLHGNTHSYCILSRPEPRPYTTVTCRPLKIGRLMHTCGPMFNVKWRPPARTVRGR